MNLPNQLTLLRLTLTFFFVAVLSVHPLPYSKTCALLIFAVAALTDFLDGYLARKNNQITNFGKLMDPLADKILMCAGFVLLITLEHIPAWIVVVILSREFLVTGLRLLASAEGEVLAAEGLGKYKTIFQMITILYFLFFEAAGEPAFAWAKPFLNTVVTRPETLGTALVWISLILTMVSGGSYVWKNRQLLR